MEETAPEKPVNGLDEAERGGEHLVGSETPVLQDEHYQKVAFLAKSLSDANRLRIILCVSNGKRSVSSIVEELGLSQPLVSHHLKELKRSLLVTIERSGPFIYYELVDPRILDVIRTLSTVATDLLTARKTF